MIHVHVAAAKNIKTAVGLNKHMVSTFPNPITNLPEADLNLNGARAFVSQSDNHQILFMEFNEDLDMPEHEHDDQYGIVIDGKIKITIEGKTQEYKKGDSYFIPKGVKHSIKIDAGYADITFFNQKDRYTIK